MPIMAITTKSSRTVKPFLLGRYTNIHISIYQTYQQHEGEKAGVSFAPGS